jgi:hypothetical protein
MQLTDLNKMTRSFDKSRILPADSMNHSRPDRGLWENPAFGFRIKRAHVTWPRMRIIVVLSSPNTCLNLLIMIYAGRR